jgi:hypothetical protein
MMCKLIEIINISTNIESNNKSIRLDFRYNGDIDKKITVKLYEQFFNLGYRAIGGEINIRKGVNYWISDNFSNGLIFRFNGKVKISFDDIENNDEIIYEEIINIGNTNLNNRSKGKDMSLKNIFFLGDSNVYHYFSKYKYDSKEYFFDEKVLVPIDVPELSVNRFINSNPQRFIDSLPIMSDDIIILNLGEIDCRVALFRNAKLKGRTLINHINDVIDRYVKTIIELINNNQNIEVVICLPHPPMSDGWVKERDVDHLLKESTEKDRMFISQYFSRYLIDKLNEIGVNYIYPFKGLEDKEGFMNNDYLLPYDNHTKDNDIVLTELKQLL